MKLILTEHEGRVGITLRDLGEMLGDMKRPTHRVATIVTYLKREGYDVTPNIVMNRDRRVIWCDLELANTICRHVKSPLAQTVRAVIQNWRTYVTAKPEPLADKLIGGINSSGTTVRRAGGCPGGSTTNPRTDTSVENDTQRGVGTASENHSLLGDPPEVGSRGREQHLNRGIGGDRPTVWPTDGRTYCPVGIREHRHCVQRQLGNPRRMRDGSIARMFLSCKGCPFWLSDKEYKAQQARPTDKDLPKWALKNKTASFNKKIDPTEMIRSRVRAIRGDSFYETSL